MKKDYSDCYYPGLFSFWASNDVRIFYTPNGLPETDPSGGMPVVYHQHRYDITIHCLKGVLWNRSLVNAGDTNTLYLIGELQTPLADECMRFIPGPYTRAFDQSTTTLELNDSISLRHNEYHTVYSLPGTAWAVQEGTTSHFAPKVAVPVKSGLTFRSDLYNPFTPEMIGVDLYTELVNKAREVFNA